MQNDILPKRLSTKTIYESDWICLYADRVQMPDGSIIAPYHRLHYPHDSICVVIFNQREEILLIRSKRYITGRLEWEIPAGRMEFGETAEEAAARECREETGCSLRNLTYLCHQNPSNGMADRKIHVFAARVETEGENLDDNEVCDKCWFSRVQIKEMLKNNELQCGVSILGLLFALTFYDA